VRGIAVEHRTHVYFDIANRWTALSYVMNEILETIIEFVALSGRFVAVVEILLQLRLSA